MNELERAIQEMKQAERRSGVLKNMLQNYDSLQLTEKTYHRLCETPMRNTDRLGEDLGRVLGFSYIQRHPNSFEYALPDSYKLFVPSYDITGVYIDVPKYYDGLFSEQFAAKTMQREIFADREKISALEEGFFEGNLSERAACVIKAGKHIRIKRLRNAVRVPLYLFANRNNRCYKRFTEILGILKESEEKKLRQFSEYEKEWNDAYSEQVRNIQECCKILFKWTDKVYIRQEDSDRIIKTIRRGELQCESDIQESRR